VARECTIIRTGFSLGIFTRNPHVTPQSESNSPIAGSVLPLQKAEELLMTLQEVVSARIVVDSSGGVEAIHVLVTGQQTPKQMVRNIESALMAHLGMRVDHRKISIATTVRRPATPPQPLDAIETKVEEPLDIDDTPRRLLYFEDVEIRGSRTKGVACKVTLRCGTELVVGEAEGFGSDKSRVELAARAAMAAIALADNQDRQLALEGVKVINVFDREMVFVGVTARTGRTSTLLTGSCEIKDSAETASALAVLDATNRWVEGAK
jgi:hypothetical protein